MVAKLWTEDGDMRYSALRPKEQFTTNKVYVDYSSLRHSILRKAYCNCKPVYGQVLLLIQCLLYHLLLAARTHANTMRRRVPCVCTCAEDPWCSTAPATRITWTLRRSRHRRRASSNWSGSMVTGELK